MSLDVFDQAQRAWEEEPEEVNPVDFFDDIDDCYDDEYSGGSI